MQLSHCFCWLIPPEDRLNTCKGWDFKQHFMNHVSSEWELCKLDFPTWSNSELALLTWWNALHFLSQHLALSINTWLDSKPLGRKTFQTVKSGMWLGEQECNMSIWYMCISLKCQSITGLKLRNEKNWSCWLSPEGQARANPSEKALDVTGPSFRWRQDWSPDLRLWKDAQDKCSALERRAGLWQTLLPALRGQSTVCNPCSSLWVRPCTALQGQDLLCTCSTEPHKTGISTFSPPFATLNLPLRQKCRSLQHEASSGVPEAGLLHHHCASPALTEHCQPQVCTLVQGLIWTGNCLPQLRPQSVH